MQINAEVAVESKIEYPHLLATKIRNHIYAASLINTINEFICETKEIYNAYTELNNAYDEKHKYLRIVEEENQMLKDRLLELEEKLDAV